jgi:hypothetical protein
MSDFYRVTVPHHIMELADSKPSIFLAYAMREISVRTGEKILDLMPEAYRSGGGRFLMGSRLIHVGDQPGHLGDNPDADLHKLLVSDSTALGAARIFAKKLLDKEVYVFVDEPAASDSNRPAPELSVFKFEAALTRT